MEKRLTVMTVMVAVAFVGGIIAASGISNPNSISTAEENSAGLTGHVSLAVYDTFGNIKQYVQGDNTILNDGDNCILEDVIHVAVTGCAGTHGSNTAFVQIGLGSSGAASAEADTGLLTLLETAKTGAAGTSTPASGTGASSVTVTRTFFDPGAATYREAALSNSDGDFLARNTFTTAATLTATDDLVVAWTISIDN